MKFYDWILGYVDTWILGCIILNYVVYVYIFVGMFYDILRNGFAMYPSVLFYEMVSQQYI